MSRRAGPQFPETLQAMLENVRHLLHAGRLGSSSVVSAIEALAQLPPDIIGWADQRIALAAGLHEHTSLPRAAAIQYLLEMPDLAWLFQFHRDGRLREIAAGRLPSAPPSPFLLSALAWRLNDWAGPVRIAAHRRAAQVFPETAADVVAVAAPYLVTRWKHWGRWEAQSRALVDALCSRSDVGGMLAHRFATELAGPLPSELRHSLRLPSLDGHLISLFRTARSPGVRVVALDTLLRGRAAWATGSTKEWIDKRYFLYRRKSVHRSRSVASNADNSQMVMEALRDRSVLVRRVAAGFIVERENALPVMGDALRLMQHDRDAGIQQRAAFLLDVMARRRSGPASSPTGSDGSRH